jgi:hypothetical protein
MFRLSFWELAIIGMGIAVLLTPVIVAAVVFSQRKDDRPAD